MSGLRTRVLMKGFEHTATGGYGTVVVGYQEQLGGRDTAGWIR
jgi:hypothetical protein